MKIKGSVEIHVVDSRTGEIKQTIKQNNLITNTALLEVLFWGAQCIATGLGQNFGGNFVLTSTRISISTSTATPTIFSSTLTNIVATGYVPSGISSPTYNSSTTPPFGQIQNRIDFTGTDRTFTTVGLTRLSSSNSQNTSATTYAYLLLDTPCTQGAYDYLDIFYRIQFFNTEGQNYSPQSIIDFGRSFFGDAANSGAAFNMSTLYTFFGKKPSKDFNYISFNYPLLVSNSYNFSWNNRGFNSNADVTPNPSGARINSHFKFKIIYSYELNDRVGMIFNSMFQGGNSTQTYTCSEVANSNSVFQNLFSHSSNATVPFFDSLKLASGNGKVLLNGNWTGKLPELYRITIDKDGATGTSAYRWSVRKHLGFDGNTYSDRSVACPFRNPNTPAATGMQGWHDQRNDVLRWNNTKIVQYQDTGVTLLDLLDGSYINWHQSSTPALPVTQARQVAVDPTNQRIYVACRESGLWMIDITANTITRIKDSPCYGVDVGRNNVVYVVINSGLYSSADFSTPLNFSYTGISDNNWSKVYYLKVDPEHVEDRLAIVMQPPTAGNRRVVWHQITAPILASGEFRFDTFGDANGLCYWIGTDYGTGAWQNPHTAGRVTCQMSSVEQGTQSNLVNRQGGVNHHTQSIANSWVSIDLGVGNTLIPNYYLLQNRGQFTGHVPRNWKLQGSNNAASNSVADLNAATWIDLDTRVNDTTMSEAADAWAGYSVSNSTQGYRWLRILQNGLNSSSTSHLLVAEFEFYGIFSSTTASRVPPSRGFNQTVTGVESSSLKPWAAAMDVSDTGSFWVDGNLGKLNYGSVYITTLNTSLCSQQLTHSVWGSDRYFKVAFYKNFLIGRDKIVNDAAVVQNTYTSFGDKTFLIHLEGGIALTNREMRQMFTDNSYCWQHFGWQENQWVINASGSKTTHADEQPLANGITIKFQDGASAPHFTATDYYTQSLNYGTLKDNATSLYYETAWYSKPAQFDYPVQAELTVPATSNNPPPAATRFWRLRNLTPSGGQGYWVIREIIFRDQTGADITTGGVASASFNSSTASRAFDKSTNTSSSNFWEAERYGLNWIQYTFSNPVVVYSISINPYIPNSGYVMPTDYVLEYSNDDISWQSAYEFRTSIIADNTYYTIAHQYNTAYNAILNVVNDPNFVRIETDSVELTKLTLNGQPLATTYVEAGIPPAPNEAVIFGDGRVKFNAADASKIVGGTYAYIKN